MDDEDDPLHHHGLAVVEKLSRAGNDWEALDEAEQELAALWKLEADMFNGGFLQFFGNHGMPGLRHALRGLARIGATRSLQLVEAAYGRIVHLEDDPRISSLQDIPSVLSDDEREGVAGLDRAFCQISEVSQRFEAHHHPGRIR